MQPGTKKVVRYLDIDVLTAAKQRIAHVLDTFDEVHVAFSGGKDSLVTLHLVEEVCREQGSKAKVNVFFRDEELIPDDVINFVLEHAASGRYNFRYVAVPMDSHKFILGRTIDYVQWDWRRPWLRPKPAIAVTDLGAGEQTVYSQYDMDQAMFAQVKGKVAVVTGIRADESLVRYRSCVNKVNENYINATDTAKVKLVKPIYDWTQPDVFRYFYDRGIKYCSIYDAQTWNRMGLRVSTPLHAESAKRFGKLRTLYPTFYEQLVTLFPEMLAQEKYWDSLDRFGAIASYPHTWAGVLQYVNENIEDHQAEMASERVNMARKIRENNRRTGKSGSEANFWGYPILYVFKQVVAGNYKRVIQPCKNPTKEEIEYERPVALPALAS
jgi:predicted phosphoadenosine phosphosulfate sulfurtransferase